MILLTVVVGKQLQFTTPSLQNAVLVCPPTPLKHFRCTHEFILGILYTGREIGNSVRSYPQYTHQHELQNWNHSSFLFFLFPYLKLRWLIHVCPCLRKTFLTNTCIFLSGSTWYSWTWWWKLPKLSDVTLGRASIRLQLPLPILSKQVGHCVCAFRISSDFYCWSD